MTLPAHDLVSANLGEYSSGILSLLKTSNNRNGD